MSTKGFAQRFGPIPWPWTRRQIAERWNCKPYEVDLAPRDEVELELQLMLIESDARPKSS